jgi:putative nucleotidyltransferase with HDIG domain
MRFDVEHFRTKLGGRIVRLFVLSALLPTATLSFLSYRRVRSELLDQSTEMMELGTTDAQMGALERLQSVESELMILGTSPTVGRALGGTGAGPSGTLSLRRISALTLATSDATIPIVGDLTDTPELPPETLANLDRGESALAVILGAGGRPEVLIARAPGEAGTDAGVLWARVIADSLWITAQVYAVGVAASEIDFQDDRGYCVLDGGRRPLDCAGALVSWFSEGVPEDVYIPEGSIHGPLSWADDGRGYAGHYRHLFLRGFNSDDWIVVLGRDERSMLQPLVEFQRTLLGFLVLTVALVLWLSLVGIRQSMEPLARLREGTRRLAAKDFSARVLISSGDEFEELAGSFNYMAQQVGTLVEELRDLNWSTITTLARTIDAKSSWTAGHSERVSQMSVAIAKVMGLPAVELERLYRGGLLHDIGKIGVPLSIIDKKGRLTDEEMAVMKSHVTIGARILEPLTALKDVLPIVLYHHERFDGKGYEAGLRGTDIPFLARILCVADSYDAMRSDRPYRAGRSPDETLEEIALCTGSQFDPDVVEAFVEYMASEEGELASIGRFSKPFGVPAEARVKSSRTLAPAESVGL